MKIAFLIALLACVYAESALEATIGESCEKDPNYVIQSFVVTPWPLIRTEQYNIFISGVFTQKEYVKQIYFATRFKRGFWHYTYQSVYVEYEKGSSANFTISIQAPSEKGPYTDKVSLHRHDFSKIACWEYDYDL